MIFLNQTTLIQTWILRGRLRGKNILSEYLNTGKLPTRLHGVYLYPQSYHVHNHTWTEYPDEPCSSHCMIPTRTDKSFAKFYLSNSFCQKHNSSLTGPWVYLSNRFSTLPKLYKCWEICHFITLLNQKVRATYEIRDSLIACQLVENQHVFNTNNKGRCFSDKMTHSPWKGWHQSYNLDDMPSFTAKLHYYLQRGFCWQNTWCLSKWSAINIFSLLYIIYNQMTIQWATIVFVYTLCIIICLGS